MSLSLDSVSSNTMLAHWTHPHSGGVLPDWGKAAHLALEMSASTDGFIPIASKDSTSPTSSKKL